VVLQEIFIFLLLFIPAFILIAVGCVGWSTEAEHFDPIFSIVVVVAVFIASIRHIFICSSLVKYKIAIGLFSGICGTEAAKSCTTVAAAAIGVATIAAAAKA